MATNVSELAKELYQITAWQRTPEILSNEDYENMIVYGIKTLYIDTGRAQMFSKDMLYTLKGSGVEPESEYDNEYDLLFSADLPIDEERYVMLTAEIMFFKKVQSDVNNIVGYTTDALTVTNADKPYAHLQDTITGLENERRIVFYKMTNYSFFTG